MDLDTEKIDEVFSRFLSIATAEFGFNKGNYDKLGNYPAASKGEIWIGSGHRPSPSSATLLSLKAGYPSIGSLAQCKKRGFEIFLIHPMNPSPSEIAL